MSGQFYSMLQEFTRGGADRLEHFWKRGSFVEVGCRIRFEEVRAAFGEYEIRIGEVREP